VQLIEPGRPPAPGLEVLAESEHVIAWSRSASYRKASKGYVLRIQMAPSLDRDGNLHLRVGSEVSQPEGRGYSTRRHDSEARVSSGQALLVSGLAQVAGEEALDRLFAGKLGKRDLVVLITPEWSRTVALGKSR
jgi:hypothetical protein